MDCPSESLEMETVPSRYSPGDVYQDNAFCVQGPATHDDDEAADFFAGQDRANEIREELYGYLDMVKKMVTPGCSPEVLEVALGSVSSLFEYLAVMSSQRPRASL